MLQSENFDARSSSTFNLSFPRLTFDKLFLTLLNSEYPGNILVSTGGDLTIQPSHNTSEMAGKASIFANDLQNCFSRKNCQNLHVIFMNLRTAAGQAGAEGHGAGQHRATVCLSLRRLPAKVKLRKDNNKY